MLLQGRGCLRCAQIWLFLISRWNYFLIVLFIFQFWRKFNRKACLSVCLLIIKNKLQGVKIPPCVFKYLLQVSKVVTYIIRSLGNQFLFTNKYLQGSNLNKVGHLFSLTLYVLGSFNLCLQMLGTMQIGKSQCLSFIKWFILNIYWLSSMFELCSTKNICLTLKPLQTHQSKWKNQRESVSSFVSNSNCRYQLQI